MNAVILSLSLAMGAATILEPEANFQAELSRFPEQQEFESYRLANGSIKRLEDSLWLRPGRDGEIRQAIKVARCNLYAWGLLANARNPHCARWQRREWSQELCDLLGPENWANGQMPPLVCWWLFPEKD